MRDVPYVQAAGRHRRRHQEGHPSGLEVGQRLLALALQPVSVDGRGGKLKYNINRLSTRWNLTIRNLETHVGLTQVGGEEVRVLLLLDEDERLLRGRRLSRRLEVLQDRDELLPLGELGHLEEGLRHVGARPAHDANRQEEVVGREELGRQALHLK